MTSYSAILKMVDYWLEPVPSKRDDEWRRANDLDCILASRDPSVEEETVLRADMIISLWLPLRYALNYFGSSKWEYWREYGAKHRVALKSHPGFLHDLKRDMQAFLPEDREVTKSLERLFAVGQTRANVMILPERRWNIRRGRWPYYDYVPHFLSDLLEGKFGYSENEAEQWIKSERLDVFFDRGCIARDGILDLIGSGSPTRHEPTLFRESLPSYLDICSQILEKRSSLI